MEEIHIIPQCVKNELIQIYEIFSFICKKHNLKHWLGYGTMLGAVRHHGFIPWDDDLDVFMMREDYNKFLLIAQAELPRYFKLVTYQNCREYPHTFAKIQESRYEVYNKVKDEAGYVNPQGLYIDIFSLDSVPEKKLVKIIDIIRSGLLYCRYSYIFRQNCHTTTKGKIAGFIGSIINHKINNENDFSCASDKIYKYDSKNDPNSKYVRRADFQSRFNHSRELLLPRVAFKETIFIQFENIIVPIPKGYRECLTSMYGSDYMIPPPIEKRVSEHSKQPIAPWYYGPDIE